MDVSIGNSWKEQLSSEFEKPYFKSLMDFIETEYQANPNGIFPGQDQIFRAFNACDFEEVKVVILGQDPYPTRGHAHGLCFSVERDVRPLPKSLKNIFKELQEDLGISPNEHGDLSGWAKQGVLLLNATLTVREGKPESHANKGWEIFTDTVIEKLNNRKSDIVYILWGSKAIRKASNVNPENNLILTAPHPSPLSAYRGFFGCKHFSRVNDYLKSTNQKQIKW